MAKRKKRKQETCHCPAYKFPHRYLGGKCADEQEAKRERQYLSEEDRRRYAV